MGQYWKPVNLDKKEYINPHKLGCGLKLWEQIANHPSTGTALVILCTKPDSVGSGGGDFDVRENWHGPERKFPDHSAGPGPMPEDYSTVAKRTIGRWAGDKILIVGDYGEDGYYEKCADPKDYGDADKKPSEFYTDVTDDVCRVIEHELNGQFEGSGWRQFVKTGK